MEFIEPEEFLKQDKEVQKVFIKWWKPKFGDLYSCDNHRILKVIDEDIESELKEDKDFLKHTIYCFNSLKDKIIPLFTEGQLRQFIEDKTSYKIEFIPKVKFNKITYDMDLKYFNGCDFEPGGYKEDLGNNLLQAYWKVAVQIAKENIDN